MVSETKLGACVFKVVKLQPSIKTATADRACTKARGKVSKAKAHAGITTVTRRRKARKGSRKNKARKARKGKRGSK